MTGAQHYAAAEKLLEQAEGMYVDDPAAPQAIAMAQVHATLAAAFTNRAELVGQLGQLVDTLADLVDGHLRAGAPVT